ncbi:LysR family transcriptional regulator [Kiloniella sp.]|uniref:LysR family transcriptional regulator n=1 Tax=Kiloniella sp. TaxID=1938587 RepID=UPI003B01F701
MNWDDAKIFLAVAAAGSYASAARELGLTHPTIGRRIQGLESTLGGRLFDKSAQGVVLTPRGEELVEHAEAMERAAGRFKSTARESTGLRGVVRISCGSPMHSFIVAHLPDLYLRYPELRIELDDSSDYVNLSRGEADIAIRSRLPETGALKVKKLVHADMAIFAGHGYLARHPFHVTRDLSDFDWENYNWANYDWVVHDERMSHYPYMQWLMPLLAKRPPRLRVMRRYSQLEAMINGIGLGVLPVIEGGRFTELGQITPALPQLRFPQYIIAHETNLRSSRVRLFWDWLTDTVKQHRNDFGKSE